MKRASAVAALTIAASAAALAGGADAATAATAAPTATTASAAGYVNELWIQYQNGGSSYNDCQVGRAYWNNIAYGNLTGETNEYFYCASGANGSWNLWWRHPG
ncbi:hypothetical protein [Streptomyces achromogenes]|uniref:hypothetical protein n=1 Tax=Streptomyces achromogenes TaxID=67255 RepID=UPI0036F6C42D